jgi:hypothetical protein
MSGKLDSIERATMAREELVFELVRAARRELNHDAGDDEPQDLYEIARLTKVFRRILNEGRRNDR